MHKVGVLFNGEHSSTVFEDTVDEDFTGLYPAIISAFQVGDIPMIGKIMTENEVINDRFGELINERNILIMGNILFGMPTITDIITDLESLLID